MCLLNCMGGDNNVVPPLPRDQGSRWRSIVVVVVALGIPSQCLSDRQIDDNDSNVAIGEDGNGSNNGNDTGAVAG
jgi:hypothetical protein